MVKTDQDYLKLMTVIHTYSDFSEKLFGILNGIGDDEEHLKTLDAVEESFIRAREIKNESYRLIAETLIEEMTIWLKKITG